jgi:3-hydroxyisobutyrate dehydrogenase-like beta-hydroxyacid dehydrogenase
MQHATNQSTENKLGFFGIGYMGRPIAQRLLDPGFKLTVYDRGRSKAEKLVPYGGIVAESLAELASRCDVVLSCLPRDEAVLNIYKEGKRICERPSRLARH